jgi:hypothetical protein
MAARCTYIPAYLLGCCQPQLVADLSKSLSHYGTTFHANAGTEHAQQTHVVLEKLRAGRVMGQHVHPSRRTKHASTLALLVMQTTAVPHLALVKRTLALRVCLMARRWYAQQTHVMELRAGQDTRQRATIWSRLQHVGASRLSPPPPPPPPPPPCPSLRSCSPPLPSFLVQHRVNTSHTLNLSILQGQPHIESVYTTGTGTH